MDKTLLAVDDEKSILMILDFVFGNKYKVVQKTKGQEASEWLQQGNMSDVIVADMNKPEVNGFEFIL